MAWLTGWAKRVKLTIDQTDIDANLANFPVLLYLSTASGYNADDISFIFDELQSDANRLKIAVTTSDGTTQCYVEVEKWDDTNEKAWLWVKAPSISGTVNTDFYLYYDSTHADNTDYVGDPESTPAMTVWDANYVLVQHMHGATYNALKDSTTNNNDVTAKGGNPACQAVGKIDNAVDFESSSLDYLTTPDADSLDLTATWTIEVWVKFESLPQGGQWYGVEKYTWASTGKGGYILRFVDSGSNAWRINGYDIEGMTYDAVAGTTNLAIATWYYTAITFSDAANTLKAFLNGVQDGINNAATKSPTAGNTATLKFGQSGDGASTGFDGIMDEIRLSNVVRSDAWIKASYETGRDHLLDWGSEESGVILKEVADSLSLSDAILRNKTMTISDSVGLADVPLKGWTPQISDSIALSDTVLRNKAFQILDSLGLSDTILRGKQFSVSDSISLSELITVITEIIKQVTDSLSLSDIVSLNKALVLADQIRLTDNVYVNKILVISDDMALVEVVEKSVQGVVKTRIFLIIGDLAIQLTGD